MLGSKEPQGFHMVIEPYTCSLSFAGYTIMALSLISSSYVLHFSIHTLISYKYIVVLFRAINYGCVPTIIDGQPDNRDRPRRSYGG